MAHDKQEHETGQELSRQALAHSQRAFQHIADTHSEMANEQSSEVDGHADAAALAHKLWQARGCPEGSAQQNCFQAAQVLRVRAEE